MEPSRLEHYSAVAAEMLPSYFLVEMEARIMAHDAIQGGSSFPREKISRIRAGTKRNSASLSCRCKNAEEVKSHLDHQKKKLLVQISTRTALH